MNGTLAGHQRVNGAEEQEQQEEQQEEDTDSWMIIESDKEQWNCAAIEAKWEVMSDVMHSV